MFFVHSKAFTISTCVSASKTFSCTKNTHFTHLIKKELLLTAEVQFVSVIFYTVIIQLDYCWNLHEVPYYYPNGLGCQISNQKKCVPKNNYYRKAFDITFYFYRGVHRKMYKLI
jgi:hypothetical protein